MNVYRLQTLTKAKGNQHIGEYCLENNIAAMGWDIGEAIIERFEDYIELAKERHSKYDSVKTLNQLSKMKDSIIWMRCNGIYYISKVDEKSKWLYCGTSKTIKLDAPNHLSNIFWHKVGEESDVAGMIRTGFIQGKTLQRIAKAGIEEYSKFIYNKITNTNYYTISKFENPEESFYNHLSPDDCEDLLYFWLYKEYGYICIPSTNKMSTQRYECVLLDSKDGKKIFIQVKNSNVILNKNDYQDLDGEVWLFSTKGEIIGDAENVKVATKDVLYKFIENNRNILSESIKDWYDFVNVNLGK